MSQSISNIKILVLTGDGINCEEETALAFRETGAQVNIIHIQDLIENPGVLDSAHILALPGGFSFGDEIGSGQILALKIKYALGDAFRKFVEEKKLIIGICNGFQALVRLGLLPEPFKPRVMTLTHNRQGHFINRWVDLKIPASECVWTQKLQAKNISPIISLPIRHGEGRIVFQGDESTQRMVFNTLHENKQIALTYTDDVNGSYERIAGVCDPSGLVFGLMPHPEAAISNWQNPSGKEKNSSQGIGALIFESAIEYCQKNF